MRRENKHNLLIGLLALLVVFAPLQAAVSAIDMLDQHRGQPPHCQMDMTDNMDPAGMEHGDCCQHGGACQGHCTSCSQCISVHAALLAQPALPAQSVNQFDYLKTSPAKGIPGRNSYRPPRFFS